MIFIRHVGRNGRVFGVDSVTNNQGSITNRYVAGSGVGATSSFARRAKLYRSVTTKYSQPAIVTTPSIKLLASGILNTIATKLRLHMAEFRNNNFWAYSMDGTNSYSMDGTNSYIFDGGKDMFDTGMFITPWLNSGVHYDLAVDVISGYPYSILYDTSIETIVDTNCNYISLGYIHEDYTGTSQVNQSLHPLTVICYRLSGPVGWQNGGKTGSVGTGTVSSGYIYENTIVNGFTVYAGYRQIYGATSSISIPSICQLVILLGHPSWGSVFGPVIQTSDNAPNNCKFVMYSGAGTKNVMAINTLLSEFSNDSGKAIPILELQTVVFNFTKRIKEACTI